MSDIKKITQDIQGIFNENKMFYDFTVNSDGIIEIVVENGDWKHDHLALQHIMRLNGYKYLGRHISDEESGDDSFTAIYLYK